MDSSDHPVVQRGIKAAELISHVKSFLCFEKFFIKNDWDYLFLIFACWDIFSKFHVSYVNGDTDVDVITLCHLTPFFFVMNDFWYYILLLWDERLSDRLTPMTNHTPQNVTFLGTMDLCKNTLCLVFQSTCGRRCVNVLASQQHLTIPENLFVQNLAFVSSRRCKMNRKYFATTQHNRFHRFILVKF